MSLVTINLHVFKFSGKHINKGIKDINMGILLEKTKEILGRKPRLKDKVIVQCDICNTESWKHYSNCIAAIKKFGKYRCQKCVAQDPDKKASASRAAKRLRQDPNYIAKMDKIYKDPNYRQNMSEKTKAIWEDPNFIKKMQDYFEESKQKRSESTTKLWENPEFRDKMLKSQLNADYINTQKQNGRKAVNSDAYKNSMKKLLGDKNYLKQLSQYGKKAWTDEFKRRIEELYSSEELIAKIQKRNKDMWTDEMRQKASTAAKKLIRTPEYQTKMQAWQNSPEAKISAKQNGQKSHISTAYQAAMLKLLQDPDYIQSMIEHGKATWTPKRRERARDLYNDPTFIKKISASCKKIWENPEYREKMAIIRSQQPRCSSLQTTLYSILDDLGIKYYREYPDKAADPETIIGPYNFDCVIPREDKPTLLIECQGEYWHAQTTRNDCSKASYIANNLSDQYELKQIWEHEFGNKDKIAELLKYWMGLTKIEAINFNFKDAKIELCKAQDYRLLLSKYHYLPSAGRGGIAYGAYLGEELIAVCVFSPVVRQNINIEDYKQYEIRELSRFCIHPKYQKKNFASWFISRCIKSLDSKYKVIISYCDTTYNHDGSVYKAANFVQDKEVPPDYWYVSKDGWVMHKKTLYSQAVKMGLKEAEYAAKWGYIKIYGDKKLRFLYIR